MVKEAEQGRLLLQQGSKVNSTNACIPSDAQAETETPWPRPKRLTLNLRSVLSWILLSNKHCLAELSFFAEQNLQGQSVSSDDAFKALEEFRINSVLCFLLCFLNETTSLNVLASELRRGC